jgi:cytoskeleton-associated protein 5
LAEEKENSGDALAGKYGRGQLNSPSLERNGRTSAASGSGGRNSPAPPPYQNSRMSRDVSSDAPKTEGQGVESWKRAAEVTSALRAKIEQMKVCGLLMLQAQLLM